MLLNLQWKAQKNINLQEIELGLIIIGDAIRFLPYFIFVFSEVGKVGVGKGRGNYELQKVFLIKDGQNETIYTKNNGIVKNIDKLSFEFSYKHEDTDRVTLHFLSPVRMKCEGKLVFEPEFHHLVRSLLRRIYLLSLFWHNLELKLNFSDLIRKSEKVVVRDMDIKWFDWTRFSSRQNTKMKLGGFVGKITYEGKLTEFMPFLRLGELIHIGKNCSFGLGKYKIV
ncbi:MAG: CRISPR system precrRNA processing endoribonuclease RAMP protein Cas6 [Candidatus Calescibacterium sp.]|nr:CRISPR system precrRNA processing endoribonuclease RAMP protein Cas6 [Candidatus Calescibacterium sp.]MDW8087498.1 CRISPR system precrRNA processing endoribonuclease RAMP protein Cas6 [Candidatus Calescibacterium sp.]